MIEVSSLRALAVAVIAVIVTLAPACEGRPTPKPAGDPVGANPTVAASPAAEDGFEPLGPAPAGSWRARIDERGQSFADYEASTPNRPRAPRQVLYLQPLAPFPNKVVLPGDLPSIEIEEQGFITFVFSPTPEQFARFLTHFYGLEARVLEALPLESLSQPARVHQNHAQYDARVLLETLGPSLPADAYSMTVLMARDLIVSPEQEFAFGYGLHVDRLAISSFAQLDAQFLGQPRSPEFQTRIRERSHKLLAHEVGHTLGMQHCDHYACVMNGVAHLRELDATPLHLCPICLRKLMWLVELDPRARYEGLADYYEDLGLDTERAWVHKRLAAHEASPRVTPSG